MELTIENLIKIIIGAFVVVAVVLGVYLAFKNKILDFFQNLPSNFSSKFILELLW